VKITFDAKYRRDQILKEATQIARELGCNNVNKTLLARQLRISPSLINYYFGSVSKLHKLIIKKAIKENDIAIIAFEMINKNKRILKSPKNILIDAQTFLINRWKDVQ
jgi:AcrR family transcriptional regulator